MEEQRRISWRRRDFLAASVAGLAAPLSLSLTAQGASGRSIGSGLMKALVERDSASIGYWSASENLGNLSEISLSTGEPDSNEASSATDGGIVPAKRITPVGIGREGQIRVAGCAVPKLRCGQLSAISIDVLFDTAQGRLPVHALHADCSCSGGGSGGEMVLPVEGGCVSIAAGTHDSQRSILEIPARRGVYIIGWRDPHTGALPRWRSVRIETHFDTVRLVTGQGKQPDFSYAVVTLARSLA